MRLLSILRRTGRRYRTTRGNPFRVEGATPRRTERVPNPKALGKALGYRNLHGLLTMKILHSGATVSRATVESRRNEACPCPGKDGMTASDPCVLL